MADGKKVQKKKVTAGGRVTPKAGSSDVPSAGNGAAVDDVDDATAVDVPDAPAQKTSGPADAAPATGTKARKAAGASGTGPKLTSSTGDQHTGDKPKRTSGRVTEKGTDGKGRPVASTRYTPPADRVMEMPSPWYVPAVMFTLWGLGILMIFLNYVELLPGAQSNWYLLGGLGAILTGIIVATQYR